jgi:uncharacterized membrane-anchored protein
MRLPSVNLTVATASRRRFPRCSSRRTERRGNAIRRAVRLGGAPRTSQRLRAGDVAVIDHVNIDRIAAEELIATGARVSSTPRIVDDGRYPNAGR